MTRAQILEAAAQIFSQKGYHGASMQDIALAVNLQKGSLYHHVSSKQEILYDLLNHALELLNEKVTEAIQRENDPESRLRAAIKAYLTTLAEYQELASVMLLEHRSLEPKYRVQHIPNRDRFEKIWKDLIQQGKEAGVFDCLDESLSARAILSVANWTVTWYRKDGPLTAAEIADQFADLFLRGLLKREEDPDQ